MKLARIKELRAALDAESISYGELAEIDDAFAEIDPATLNDLPENAMASDMLDELEARAFVPNVLNATTAILGIEAAVAERGADYVYTEHFEQCEYRVTEHDESGLTEEAKALQVGAPKCIVGFVFKCAGFDLTTLSDIGDDEDYLNGQRPRTLALHGWLEADERVLEALTAAQRKQDGGETWGDARAAFMESLGRSA